MPIRPMSHAQPVFGPHVDQLISIVEEAHANFINVCGTILHSLGGGTKASAVRDLIVSGLRAWAESVPGVHFFKEGNLCWVGFKNNWIVRVKMLDDKFCVGVSPTEASDQYNCNMVPESIKNNLLEEQEATLLYLGWRTTENAPLKPDVSLVCNNSFGEPHWIWPLRGSEPPPMLELHVPTAPGGGDDGLKRVRVKAARAAREA